jgi:YHS domain-containing protein
MKTKIILTSMLFLLSFTALADDSKTKDNKTVPPKPYPLKTCLVCGMTLGDMGKPFVFEYKGQEIKVCDKPERSAFDKNPDKYMKKLADAVAKLKK